MKSEHIPAGLALCRAAGWNQLAREWELFLHLSPDGCRVAINEDRVIGTVTTIRYQHFFSWIGMVLVDPAYRRQGIGMQLLKEALQILNTEQTIKLDATPAGREVYLKLDFVDEYPISRMMCVTPAKRIKETIARPLHKNDFTVLPKLDNAIFGADRRFLIEWMWKGAPQYAFLVEEDSKIQGYCMGRQGYNFTHIGPVIAENVEVAKNLLSAALNNCLVGPVILDIPHFNHEWKEWLASIGFTEQRPFIRMYRGSNRYLCIPEKQFAILGPDFG